MGWLTLTVGHLNILSATFAVMLIGMGDYGVLWVMRYEAERQARSRTCSRRCCTATAARRAGNLTAAVGTALAFFAAMLADFKAVAELGWIAGCGVLLCALACFTVLPALIVLIDRRRTPGTLARDHAGRRPRRTPTNGRRRCATGTWLPILARRPRWVLTQAWQQSCCSPSFAAVSATTTTCCTCRPTAWNRSTGSRR